MGYNSSRDGAYIVAILSNLHKVVDSTFLANSPTTENTREEIAKLAGVGSNTITKVKKIDANAIDEIKQELRKPDGKISINAAEAIASLPEKEIIKRAKEIKQARKDNTKLLNCLALTYAG